MLRKAKKAGKLAPTQFFHDPQNDELSCRPYLTRGLSPNGDYLSTPNGLSESHTLLRISSSLARSRLIHEKVTR